MNKKASNRARITPSNTISLNLAVMIIFLLCGGVAGSILSLSAHCSPNLLSLQNDIISVAKNDINSYSFWSTYFNLIKYPFIIFMLSFTAFGYVVIPIIVLLKSFFLTFSISTVLQLYGIKNFFLPVSMFGIQTFLSIPILLLTAALGVEFSGRLFSFFKNRKQSLTIDKLMLRYAVTFALLMFSLLLFTVLDVTVTPLIVSLSLK